MPTITRGAPTRAPESPARRLRELPPYVFTWLDELKHAARARGRTLVDLGMGNPDRPTPAGVVDAIAAAAADPATHGYPPFRGAPVFLAAAARFMQSRFGVTVDPDTEVLALSGAKEGIAHAAMAFLDPGDVALVPSIHYPVHARAPMLVDARIVWLDLNAANGFRPDLDAVAPADAAGARLLTLNYPHNPTGAVATRALMEQAVAFCRAHGTLLVWDAAYSEITFDGERAASIFTVPGARDVAIEMHSVSKTFNMAGARVGFAVGRAELLATLAALRSNMGYGTPAALQHGAAHALDHHAELTPAVAACYRERRDVLLAGMRSLGWTSAPPRGSMFAWLPVPSGYTSRGWTEHLVDACSVVVTPGDAFGPGGEGWFRVSLAADVETLERAVAALRDAGIRGDAA